MVPTDELEGFPAGRRRLRYVAGAILAAAGAVALYAALRPAPSGTPGDGAAPEFSLPLLDGSGTLTSEELRGRPVVLNFWASWCVPCREETPLFEQVSREYEDRGLVVVGVNVRDTQEEARKFVEEFGLTYPMVRDPGNRLAEQLGVFGLPQTFFITTGWTFLASEQGERIGSRGETVVLGAISEETLRARVEALLD